MVQCWGVCPEHVDYHYGVGRGMNMLFAHYDYRGVGIENLICLSVFGQVEHERRWNHVEYKEK